MASGPQKGERGGGREEGAPDKVTADVGAALAEAFDELGGVQALVKWGRKHPSQFYLLWAKLLPTQLNHSGAVGLAPLRLLSDEQLERLDQVLGDGDPAGDQAAGDSG